MDVEEGAEGVVLDGGGFGEGGEDVGWRHRALDVVEARLGGEAHSE